MTLPPNPSLASTFALVGVTALMIGACGSDDSSGGSDDASVEAFCEEVRALDEEGSGDDDLNQDDVDQIRSLAERAPDEIRGELETMADAFEEALALGDDPENLDEFFAIMFTDEMVAAGVAIEEFGVQECGLDPADPNDDTIEMSELEESGALTDDGEPSGPASASGMQQYFDEGDLANYDAVTAIAQTDSGWEVTGEELDSFNAVTICARAASYLLFTAPGDVVTVVDGSAPATALAVSDGAGSCDEV